MSKPKGGRALFDLLTDNGEEISDRLKRQSRWPRGEVPSMSPSVPVEAEPPLRLVDGGDDGLVTLEGGRLRISLSTRTGAIVAFVVLLLLATSFWMGRRGGRAAGLRSGYEQGRASYAVDVASDIEIARRQVPATELVADLLETEPQRQADASMGERHAGAPARQEWIRGYTYIVAQEFVASRADTDAPKAQAFLGKHGIRTALVRFPSGSAQLITVDGFKRRDANQGKMAEGLLRKVRAIGAKYYESGGGYKMEGYFRKLTRDHW